MKSMLMSYRQMVFMAICSMVMAVVSEITAVANYYLDGLCYMFPKLQDVRGDLATNTIGAIIIAVVIIGLLVVAINAFFPGFFTNMFNSMQNKLNANW